MLYKTSASRFLDYLIFGSGFLSFSLGLLEFSMKEATWGPQKCATRAKRVSGAMEAKAAKVEVLG